MCKLKQSADCFSFFDSTKDIILAQINSTSQYVKK